jgi:hypothetical protein
MSAREGPITPTLYVAASGPLPGRIEFHDELGSFEVRDVQSYRTERGWYAFVLFRTAHRAQEAKHHLLQRGFLRQRCSAFFARSTPVIRVPLPVKHKDTPDNEQHLREVFSKHGEIVSIDVLEDAAYITFSRVEQAEAGVRAMQGRRVDGWNFDIDFAPPRERPRSPRRPPSAEAAHLSSSPRMARVRSRSPSRQPQQWPLPRGTPSPATPTSPNRISPGPAVRSTTPREPVSPIHSPSRRSAESPAEAAPRAATPQPTPMATVQQPEWASAMEKLMSRLADMERRLPAAAAPTAPAVAQEASSQQSRQQQPTLVPPQALPSSSAPPAPTLSAEEIAPRFTPNRLHRSVLCLPCREKVLSGVVQEDLMKELVRCWFEGTFEPCSTGMPRRTLLDAHLNPFLAELGLRTVDLQHPAWNWFLREAVGMSEEKIRAGRTMVKVQPRPRKAALVSSLTSLLKRMTEQSVSSVI